MQAAPAAQTSMVVRIRSVMQAPLAGDFGDVRRFRRTTDWVVPSGLVVQ